MKELDFNTENAIKVLKAMENGLALEYGREVLATMITDEKPDQLLAVWQKQRDCLSIFLPKK